MEIINYGDVTSPYLFREHLKKLLSETVITS